MDRRRVVAFIPVRGGSKGIPLKNVALVGDRPLVAWSIRAALQAGTVDEVVVSTDSPVIAAVAEAFGDRVTVHRRDPATATDTASTESAMLEWASGAECDVVVLLQATSPLTTPEHVDRCVRALEAGADSALTVVRTHAFRWQAGEGGTGLPVNYDPVRRPRRQDWSGDLVESGAVYATHRTALLATGSRLSGAVALVETPRAAGHEIDDPADLVVVDALLRVHGHRPEVLRSPIRLVLTDVDGVLTDNGLLYGEAGREGKVFSARDGKGFQLLREAGVATGIITSEAGPSLTERAAKLRLDEVCLASTDKLSDVVAIAQRRGLSLREIAYIGDDVHDAQLLASVGWSACPADAVPEVRHVAGYVTSAAGGSGAFREAADRLLRGLVARPPLDA
ncbi:cytidylyltransferase domain-containing protein [Modestobacter sp. SYSU DS0290]